MKLSKKQTNLMLCALAMMTLVLLFVLFLRQTQRNAEFSTAETTGIGEYTIFITWNAPLRYEMKLKEGEYQLSDVAIDIKDEVLYDVFIVQKNHAGSGFDAFSLLDEEKRSFQESTDSSKPEELVGFLREQRGITSGRRRDDDGNEVKTMQLTLHADQTPNKILKFGWLLGVQIHARINNLDDEDRRWATATAPFTIDTDMDTNRRPARPTMVGIEVMTTQDAMQRPIVIYNYVQVPQFQFSDISSNYNNYNTVEGSGGGLPEQVKKVIATRHLMENANSDEDSFERIQNIVKNSTFGYARFVLILKEGSPSSVSVTTTFYSYAFIDSNINDESSNTDDAGVTTYSYAQDTAQVVEAIKGNFNNESNGHFTSLSNAILYENQRSGSNANDETLLATTGTD